MLRLLFTALAVPSSLILFGLITDAIRYSEMSVAATVTRRHSSAVSLALQTVGN
jgi:hypothetical protein